MTNLALLVVCLALGVLLRRSGRLPEDAPRALNGFVLNVALPALVVRHLQGLALDGQLALAALMPWVLFAAGAAFFAVLGRAAGWPRETTGGLMLSGGLANTSFVGLPMIEAFYGPAFLAVGVLVDQLGTYMVRPDHPAQTLAELLEHLRRMPGGTAYASSGAGGGPHLVSAMLLRWAGVTATHVAHRGGASSAAAILGGHAAFAFSALPQAAPLVQEGRLRALAVSTAERLPNLPEVPTVAEQGFPGFALSDWLGFWMPAGTPAEPIAYLREATAAALRQPEVRQRLARIGMIPVGSTTAAFVAFVEDQRARLAGLIRTEGIRLE